MCAVCVVCVSSVCVQEVRANVCVCHVIGCAVQACKLLCVWHDMGFGEGSEKWANLEQFLSPSHSLAEHSVREGTIEVLPARVRGTIIASSLVKLLDLYWELLVSWCSLAVSKSEAVSQL